MTAAKRIVACGIVAAAVCMVLFKGWAGPALRVAEAGSPPPSAPHIEALLPDVPTDLWQGPLSEAHSAFNERRFDDAAKASLEVADAVGTAPATKVAARLLAAQAAYAQRDYGLAGQRATAALQEAKAIEPLDPKTVGSAEFLVLLAHSPAEDFVSANDAEAFSAFAVRYPDLVVATHAVNVAARYLRGHLPPILSDLDTISVKAPKTQAGYLALGTLIGYYNSLNQPVIQLYQRAVELYPDSELGRSAPEQIARLKGRGASAAAQPSAPGTLGSAQ